MKLEKHKESFTKTTYLENIDHVKGEYMTIPTAISAEGSGPAAVEIIKNYFIACTELTEQNKTIRGRPWFKTNA